MSEWISVKDKLPDESLIGEELVFYRPLAEMSSDKCIAVKLYTGPKHQGCWDSTVPDGVEPFNPTDGCCHVTHWMPLPAPPEQL